MISRQITISRLCSSLILAATVALPAHAAPPTAAPPTAAPPTAAPPTVAPRGEAARLSDASPAVRARVFDLVWRTVRDNHYDPKMNGVNWVAVRAKYLPRAKAARGETPFYAVLNEMLGELKQSHLGAIPPESLRAAEDVGTAPAKPGGNTAPDGSATKGAFPSTGGVAGETGITAELIDGETVVVRVIAGEAGAEAGVKPGDLIIAINGKQVAPVLRKMTQSKLVRYPGEERVLVWATMESLLAGFVGNPYTLTVKNPAAIKQMPTVNDPVGAERSLAVTIAAGDARTVTVTPRKTTAQMISFAALPPLAASIETRTLAGGIGYIRFSIFLLPLSEPIKDAIHGFAARKAPAVILDLRGNRGGIGAMASGLSGTLVAKETNMGNMKTRSYAQTFIAYPQEPTYTGRVVVLTDEGSISTSEIMAAGLQEMKRATVIGRQTAGMALPSQIVTLPDGGRLQYVFADFRTPKGVFLEGRGVTPDIPVTVSRATLSASPSGDPILDTALQFLQTKEKTKQ